MTFISEHFLLQSAAAKRLYHEYAAQQPILDFHCHLSPRDIAENRRFANLTEIWLDGDHYKWRAMRANGMEERFCTGNASPYEKFMAWARTVPHTLGNPLFHWTHLELLRYFSIDELLNEESAKKIWELAGVRLQDDDLSVHGILKRFGVTAVCTTDDPADSLEHHEKIAKSGIGTTVYPTFRPDAALRTEDPSAFAHWTKRLSAAANVHIARFRDFLDALRKRHDDFHARGCRISDHGLNVCPPPGCTETQAAALFDKVISQNPISPEESANFAGFLMVYFGQLDAEKGWTKQLHLGALRNANSRALATLGRDTGFDSIGDWQQIPSLAAYLDHLDRESMLPRMILYNLNPADNYAVATLAASFTQEGIRGKVQLGSGWWFLDQKEGIEWQLRALSNCGLLANFVGMVTDSRSFLSFPRHEYFRRVLCNLLGSDMEAGLLPNDIALVGSMARNICHANAAEFLRLPRSVPRG